MKITLFKKKFILNFGFTLLCFLMLLVCCLLGTWQIHRYQYKQQLYFTQIARYQNHSTPFSDLLINSKLNNLEFYHVYLDGFYINKYCIFLTNKINEGKVGLEVLTPVQISGLNKWLLVDRGFIAQPFQNAHALSVFSKQHISGYLKSLNEYQFILGNNILNLNADSIIMQKIDLKEIKTITRHDFFPYILRMDNNIPHGFKRDWVLWTISPERHLGYAMQWFLFAFIILIGFLFVCYDNHESETKK